MSLTENSNQVFFSLGAQQTRKIAYRYISVWPSSQEIDVSADITFGSLTLQAGFVIFDLK